MWSFLPNSNIAIRIFKIFFLTLCNYGDLDGEHHLEEFSVQDFPIISTYFQLYFNACALLGCHFSC